MASFKKRYDAKKKKEAISILKAFIKLLEEGTHVPVVVGTWPGDAGTLNLKVVVKEEQS